MSSASVTPPSPVGVKGLRRSGARVTRQTLTSCLDNVKLLSRDWSSLLDHHHDVPGLRIGEVANRTQMTIDALRAWERRYRILTPARTAGGQRLYSEADVARVRFVQRLVAEGWSIPGAVARLHAGAAAAGEDPHTGDAGRMALLGQL